MADDKKPKVVLDIQRLNDEISERMLLEAPEGEEVKIMKTSGQGPTTFEPYPYQLEVLQMLERRTPLPAKVIRISTPQISDEQKDAIRKAFDGVSEALGSFTLVFEAGGAVTLDTLDGFLGSGVSMFGSHRPSSQRMKEAFDELVKGIPTTYPALSKLGDSDAERAHKRAINILGPRKGRWK